MAHRWRTALVGIVGLAGTIGLGRAGGGPAPGVAAFAPAGSVERVEQVKVRFATPMVAFGDPRLPAPIAGTCSAGATGRWVDAQSYAIDLPAPLAGGQRCAYALVPGLKDAAGATLAPRRFAFDTGGPNIRAALPDDGAERVEEDQVFLLALNAMPTPASLAANASCAIDGVGEAVPLDILPDATRATIVGGATGDIRVRNFLQKAGAVAANPEWSRGAPAEKRCRRRPLPPRAARRGSRRHRVERRPAYRRRPRDAAPAPASTSRSARRSPRASSAAAPTPPPRARRSRH